MIICRNSGIVKCAIDEVMNLRGFIMGEIQLETKPV